jgi:hypothetical protein
MSKDTACVVTTGSSQEVAEFDSSSEDDEWRELEAELIIPSRFCSGGSPVE